MKKDQSLNLISLQKSIYYIKDGVMYIGDTKITPELKTVLREQARYIQTSQFYEILKATIINESARLAWESKDWDNVQYAKSLKYWNTIISNLLRDLLK